MPGKPKIIYRITDNAPRIQPQLVPAPLLVRRTPSFERQPQHHYRSCENLYFNENPRQHIIQQPRYVSTNSLNAQHPSSPTPASVLISGRSSPVRRQFSFSQRNNIPRPFGNIHRYGSMQNIRRYSNQ